MCLSVYLGTSRPITIPDAAPGQLGAEKASWTPPPLLRNHEYVYYLGAKSKDAEPLACSCLLAEHVDWTDAGAIVRPDPTYPVSACPFDTLRALCEVTPPSIDIRARPKTPLDRLLVHPLSRPPRGRDHGRRMWSLSCTRPV